MYKSSFPIVLAGFIGVIILAGAICIPPREDPDNNGPRPTPPVGTACSHYGVACFDEFARQNAKIICFREDMRWDKRDLTWSLVSPADNLDVDEQVDAVCRAFDVWAEASGLTFTEVEDGADIKLSFDFHEPYPFDGAGNNLGYAFFPGVARRGEIYLDDGENWSLEPGEGVFDVFSVALHEIGHAVGLEHSPDEDDVMGPGYPVEGFTGLTANDVRAIRRLYGSPDSDMPPEIPPLREGYCSDAGNFDASVDPDSDGDGIPDTVEVYMLDTDPFEPDTDGDGRSDFEEVINFDVNLQSDPLNPDTDGDGSLDGVDPAPNDPTINEHTPDETCSVGTGECRGQACGCTDDADCDDGVVCTADVCDLATCECVNEDSCPGETACNMMTGECETEPCWCETGGSCNDGIACTDDFCDPVTCECVCVDNCGQGRRCNMATGLCELEVECLTSIDCDDGIACTNDWCNESTNECEHVDNCGRGELCNLRTGLCEQEPECMTNVDCDDGIACTDDWCNGVTNECEHVDICGRGEQCNMITGLCEQEPECTTNADCDDGIACTNDWCYYSTYECEHIDICPADYVCNLTTGECEWSPF